MSNSDGGRVGDLAGRRRWQTIAAIGSVILLAAALTAVAVAEKPTVVKAGNLELTINGGVTPKALPKKSYAPIALNVQGKISTADGTHPPALTSVVIDTDKNGTIDARGVPTCTAGKLEARTTTEAEKACKAAIVGSGTTDVEVLFPESKPLLLHSKLIAFNGVGGGKGKATILIHAYLSTPISAAIVTTVKVSKKANGPYGTRSVATVPKIANGAGSVTAFSLTFQKRLFGAKQAAHGYLLAKCGTGKFLAHAEAIFASGDKLGGKIVRACSPKG